MVETRDGSTGSVSDRHTPEAERFDRLWLEHRPRISRLVTRLSGDPGSVDDLLQEIGLRAFEGFRGFRRESAAYTWFYRIAVNVVLRWREKRRQSVPIDSEEASILATPSAGPEQQAVQESLRPAVRAALETLPEEQRTTLVLQLYEGMRYREIAALLDIPIGTVKSRLNAAVRHMKKELADYAL